MNKIKKSLALKRKVLELIPGCSQTFSKGPSQFVQGVAPVFLEKGAGSHVWDVDGNKYLDYIMALGPVILGYAYPAVNKAITDQLKKGISFSLPHRLEYEVAELLVDVIPWAEMVRFGKNGSDATSGAIRVARAYTGRDKIAICGYHGWHDWYIATTTRDKGVPLFNKSLDFTFQYNNLGSLEKIFADNPGEIAAVIMEGIVTEEPRENFLHEVKKIAHKNGALLIFDEIVNGFRIAVGGAHDYYGIEPDLATFGKAMANGMPLSAVVGRKEIMKIFDDVFYSFTFGGETLSLAAAKATIHEIMSKSVIKKITNYGSKLKTGMEALIKKHGIEDYVSCVGLDAHSKLKFKEILPQGPFYARSLFQQEMIRGGMLHFGVNNISYSHTAKDLTDTLAATDIAFSKLKDAQNLGNDEKAYKKLLSGQPIAPIFQLRKD